ncbi:hypothetical protein [Candidatus Uabimicrobium sp. HlEnr_7]|uniref:hypothetical protein n=1 Tax=Candidatus Uabimicrobium helgolandensis TaxID=3095367 RepID=UPI003558792B
MFVKVPLSVLKLPFFQLGHCKDLQFSLFDSEQKQEFICENKQKLPSSAEMDLLLFLTYRARRGDNDFTTSDALEFLGKKDRNGVRQSILRLASTKYSYKSKKFNLVEIEEFGTTRDKYYRVKFNEDILNESEFQVINLQKYFSLPAGYTRRFFLYLEKYRRLTSSRLKFDVIKFWSAILESNDKARKKINRIFSTLVKHGFLTKAQELKMKKIHQVHYNKDFYKDTEKPQSAPEKIESVIEEPQSAPEKIEAVAEEPQSAPEKIEAVVKESQSTPEKWNDIIENAWKNNKNGYDREKFYRLYGDNFWTPEDEAEYQSQVETIDQKSGDFNLGKLSSAPIHKSEPTYAEKKEQFEKQYPILSRQQIKEWISENLKGFSMPIEKIISKYFSERENEFCEFWSRNIISSYKNRGGFSPKIAMVKIKNKEEFCFVSKITILSEI